MLNAYQIEIKPIHHSECFIVYTDALGELKIWADRSPLPEYDYVTSEPEFGITGDRLSQVLENILDWAKEHELSIKVWKENELGI